jgi:hypothetical protein
MAAMIKINFIIIAKNCSHLNIWQYKYIFLTYFKQSK